MTLERWPALPLAEWRDTYATLHMWTQVVGKLVLATTPLSNHWWNVAFRLTSRGFATPPMSCGGGCTLGAVFDLVSHRLELHASTGAHETIALGPKTVARFHADVMAALHRMGIEIAIWTMPVEVPDAIRFENDTVHRSYDPKWASAFWRALDSMRPVFEEFRGRFLGKCSPLHFFWGSFDLALTRFSGHRAPDDPSADAVTREAYSHEVISQGFWPGGVGFEDAAFYAYAAPEPAGFKGARVRPDAATYDTALNEFLLPYQAVRTSSSPERDLMLFLESTYEQGAALAHWDRHALER
ncbi:MAG TPA: DUF5996 family protein [Usitatibacter sp.]|jgi:hypothetical protein|nr:DUF5996 family protein [Usitatibacter sp.]